jgi:homoserine dehydrogenase
MVKPLRLGVAGLGTVGIGLLDLLAKHGPEITRRAGRPVEVTAVCARDRTKNRGHDLSRLAWFDDPKALAQSDGIDVFVELMGGEGDPAKSAVMAALGAG